MTDSLWQRLRALAGGSAGPATAGIADDDWRTTVAALPLLDDLVEEELTRLRALAAGFLAHKRIEPAAGQRLDASDCARIAAQACLPLLGRGFGLDHFRGWRTVVVHPDEFLVSEHEVDEAGIAHEWEEARAGESWEAGPVVLSWADVKASGQRDGYNVVIHEIAHKLDMLNGDTNGFPPLHADMNAAAWSDALGAAYEDLARRIERDEPVPVDDYAATSPGEFFAVLSEYFFEWPEAVRAAWPAVYAQLAAFYRQDPFARVRRRAPAPACRASRRRRGG